MNKYLIVAFYVLTGCAVTVSFAECEALNVNKQLLAEWCSNALDENHPAQHVLCGESCEKKISVKTTTKIGKLLKNTPLLPEFLSENTTKQSPVVQIKKLELPQQITFPLSHKNGKSIQIRAPSVS